MIGTKVVVSERLRGGIPQYDIVNGNQVETGRIHAMTTNGTLFVSPELLESMKELSNV